MEDKSYDMFEQMMNGHVKNFMQNVNWCYFTQPNTTYDDKNKEVFRYFLPYGYMLEAAEENIERGVLTSIKYCSTDAYISSM